MRIPSFFRRRKLNQRIDEELQFHLRMQMEENIGQGMSPSDADAAARRKLGNMTQVSEEVYRMNTIRFLEETAQNARFSLRTLRRSPAFTSAAILTLAIGIGANAAIFSLFNQILFQRLPVQEPERLVLLDWNGNAVGTNYGSDMMSYPLCRDFQKLDQFFDGVFCRYPNTAYITVGQVPEPQPIEIVSGSYFRVLGVNPELGRLIEDSDDLQPDASPVAVVSHDFWQRNLGGRRDVLGSKVLVNKFPLTVIGVTPPAFRGVDLTFHPAIWIPAMMRSHATEPFDGLSRRVFWMHVFARLKPGTGAEEVNAGLQPWFRTMLEQDANRPEFPVISAEQRRSYLASTMDVLPAAGGRSGLRDRMRQPLSILITGTALLLLLACVNVANLFVARTSARAGELSTRLALGASRARIVAPLLTESMLIALAGGSLGLLIALGISEGLFPYLSDDLALRLDWRVLLFAFVVTVATGVLTGLIPARNTTRVSLMTSLRENSRLVRGGGVRLRKILVAGQIAFTLILLVGAGLFLQTLNRLYGRGPGFSSSGLAVFSASPGDNGYSTPEAKRIMQELLEKVRATPGVEDAAVANTQVLRGGTSSGPMTIQTGEQRIVTNREVHRMRVTPGFFSTLGLRILAGRDFDNRDLRGPGETGYRSIIVSESFVRRYLGHTDPIGLRVALSNRPGVATTLEIVGVVQGFSRRTMRDSGDGIEQSFIPYWDGETDGGAFYVRVRGNPESVFGPLRAAVAQVDATLPVVNLTTAGELIDESLVTERMLSTMSLSFGGVALLLSIVGLYGVMSFVVTQRTSEIGIRMALGGSRLAAAWLVLYDTLVMIAGGIVAALPAVWALSRFVESQLFGIEALDATNIVAAIAGLVFVAITAALIPAWHAATVNPLQALRQD